MRATMSLMGLYNYDSTIFDNLVVPTGVDKTKLINNLVIELAEVEILYTDPNFMKLSIGYWSQIELDAWTRLYTAFTKNYDPIENYDRYETYTDESTSSNSAQSTGSGSNTHSVTGYNSNTLQTSAKEESASSGSSSGSATGTIEHTAHLHGNIGVTSNQDMLKQELELRPQLNIYRVIIDSFRNRFCLLIY